MHDSSVIVEAPSNEAGGLQTRFEPTLDALADEDLRAITAAGHPFASAAWYRMLERLDLPAVTGGSVQLQFAVVSAGGTPVAICPLLRAQGPNLYPIYSIRRFYFESWLPEVLRSHPDRAKAARRLYACVSWFRRLLGWMNCSLDDFLIACSPLSNGVQLPIRPDLRTSPAQVIEHLLAELQRHALEHGRPLWFLGVPADGGPLPELLQAAGFQQVFFYYGNRIDLSRFTAFEDYLRSLSKVWRKSVRREIRRFAKAGVTFRIVDDVSDFAEDLSRLYENTYSRYNVGSLALSADFWTTLSETHGSNAETLLAEHKGQIVGFSQLLTSDAHGEMINYKGGRVYAPELGKTAFHFELLCYGPVRRAIELGCRTLWLGVASYQEKLHRGATQVPLYSYFWFPHRRDRWLLGRYLHECGKAARREMKKSADRPLRIVPECRDD